MHFLEEVIEKLEQLAPPYLAEKWDHVGLMVGSRKQIVKRILCALDLNEAVLEEALSVKADCIVTHHPFLFKPISAVDLDTPQGCMLEKLLTHHIAVYSMHTNYDIASGGLNDYLAEQLNLNQVKILVPTYKEQLVKVIIYVPKTHVDRVRDVIVKENPCQIGNYSGCTFAVEGTGSFKPEAGSNPYIGQTNVLEYVEEAQISFMTRRGMLEKLISAIKAVHPYEEMAYDVYALENIKHEEGIGRYGELAETMQLSAFVEVVKQVFKVPYLRVTQMEEKAIKRVALCSGSGAEFLKVAAKTADVYLTGDMKFHEAQEAQKLGIPVIDVGHYASENIAMEAIKNYLEKQCSQCEVLKSDINGETLFIR